MDNGKWFLFGGIMELGEIVEIVIKWEVKEEIGFDIEI